MKIKPLHLLGPIIGLALFAGALWVLRDELHRYRYRDVAEYVRELPRYRLLLTLAFTAASYIMLTGYDILAFRYIQHDLHYTKVVAASFIGYAFSHSVGQSLVTGGSIRYRLYSAWGLSAIDITKVVAFCSVTFWLGWLVLTGGSLALEPTAFTSYHLPHTSLHLSLAWIRPLGIAFLAISVFYLFAGFGFRAPLNIAGFDFKIPSAPLAAAQIVLSSVDLAVTAAVLYYALPVADSLSFAAFMGFYLVAVAAGSASQIPGGLGVFETTMILSLEPYLSSSDVLGALFVYRGIYYLVPLGIAAVMLAANEISLGKKHFEVFARFLGSWGRILTPHVLAFTIFIGGTVLLFSGATPTLRSRLETLGKFLPLPILELSHFLGSLAGGGLILLAYGIQRRLDAAYHLTVALLTGGIVLSLLKGLDYEEAVILGVMLAAVMPCRRAFYRKASLLNERMTPGWIAAVTITLLASVWLGIFSFKHVDYRNELWWKFALFSHAPRSLRASVAATSLAFVFAAAKLLHRAPVRHAVPTPHEMQRAREIVRSSPHTGDYLALLGDKSFLFSANEKAFIMYGIEHRSWIAMGDPVGPEEEWQDLLWDFREICDRNDGWPVFYQTEAETLPLYLDLGLTPLKIGEEARVSLEGYTLEGSQRREERHAMRKAEKEGLTFEVISPEQVTALMPELKSVSDSWLSDKNTREKGFSIGFFKEDYLASFPASLIRKEGKIVAFANMLLGAEKEELSIDLMRHVATAPGGVMDTMFVNLFLWGAREGYKWFNLGMAPLSGLESRALAPLWNRAGGLLYRHGEHFYNFQGLREYKDKFEPVWRPKYLVSRAGLHLPRILANVASLVAGGVKGIVSK